MIAWTILTLAGILVTSGCTDPSPLVEISLLNTEHSAILDNGPVLVEITLIDWASIFELEAFLVDKESSITAPPSNATITGALFIGDSISCGYALATPDDSQTIPRGCLDAFPFLARQHIRQPRRNQDFDVDLIAFPGINLVTWGESGRGMGMNEISFQQSPWPGEFDFALLKDYPSIIVVSLGTNDDAADVPVDLFQATLHTFVQRLLDENQDSLRDFCIIYPFPDFNECVIDHAEGFPVPFVAAIEQVLDSMRSTYSPDVRFHSFNITVGLRRTHTIDGLHPTKEGHEILAQNLAAQMKQSLKL